MIYHFDIREDGTLFKDEFGIELVSDDDARAEAKILAVEIMKSHSFASEQKTIRVEVRRDGDPLYAATLELSGRWAHEPAGADEPDRAGLPEPWILPPPPPGAPVREDGPAADDANPPSPPAR